MVLFTLRAEVGIQQVQVAHYLGIKINTVHTLELLVGALTHTVNTYRTHAK